MFTLIDNLDPNITFDSDEDVTGIFEKYKTGQKIDSLNKEFEDFQRLKSSVNNISDDDLSKIIALSIKNKISILEMNELQKDYENCKNVITVIHSSVDILKESGYEDISGYGKEVFNDLKNLFTQKPQDSFSFFHDNQITGSDFEKVSENATEVLRSQDKLNKHLSEVGVSFQIGELLLRTDYSKFRKHTDVIKNSSWYSPFFSRVYKEAKQMLNSLMLSVIFFKSLIVLDLHS